NKRNDHKNKYQSFRADISGYTKKKRGKPKLIHIFMTDVSRQKIKACKEKHRIAVIKQNHVCVGIHLRNGDEKQEYKAAYYRMNFLTHHRIKPHQKTYYGNAQPQLPERIYKHFVDNLQARNVGRFQ